MPRPLRLLAAAILVLLGLGTPPALAQFGKNKVHYKDFVWRTIETDHFEIFYYDGEEESAFRAARMAERAYSRLSRVLHHEIERRVPVIVYASHTDFQQTNISPGLIPEGTGGITEFTKRRVFLPFTGSYGEFDHVLTHELVHAFQVDMLFGDRPGGNPFSFQPPLWFMEGMAEYLSIGKVDPHTEMWLRWTALEGQLVPLQYMDRIYDLRVYRIGQAIWAFIGEQYGDEKIGEIMRKAVYFRSVEIALEKSLGVDLEGLDDRWVEYVRRKYYPTIVDLERPEKHGRRLFGRKGESGVHLAPSLSPDGQRVVFLRDGFYSKDIVLVSAIDGEGDTTLLRGERSGDFESLRYFYTSIGWSPDGELIAFPSKRGGEDVLNLLDVARKKIVRTFRFQMDAIYSPAFHPDGRRVVFSATRGGKSDLFEVNLDDGELTQITDDPFMARDPQWSPDGTRIAYVTDQGEETDLENLLFGPPRIAILDVSSGSLQIPRGQTGKSITPQWGPDGRMLAFVSDRDGISDIYVQDLESDRLYRLTRLVTGVTGIIETSPPFTWSRNGDRMVFTTFTGSGWDLYEIEKPLLKMQEIERLEPLARIAGRERNGRGAWNLPEPEGEDGLLAPAKGRPAPSPPPSPAPIGDEPRPGPGPEPSPEDVDARAEALPGPDLVELLAPGLPSVGIAGPGPLTLSSPPSPGGSGEEAKPLPAVTLSQVIEETSRDLPDRDSLESKPYKLRWSPDFVGASPLFASNVGFAGAAQIAVSDMLSNHVIHIGAAVYGSFDDSDLLLAYSDLSRRTNWGVALFQFRNDYGYYGSQGQAGYVSQVHRGGQASVSRPFSKFSRIEVATKVISVSQRDFEGLLLPQQTSSARYLYYGPELALVFDNVLYGWTGPVHGSRSRFSVERAFGDLRFTTSIADYRRYFPLGRAVFAVRAIAGMSQGEESQTFRVGGPETLRGFGYGTFRGENLGLLNLELRFPLLESLRLGWPLRIGLGGIHGVLFLDGGGAFGDKARPIRGGRLDDVGADFGFGFRLWLGYFALKYDVARQWDLKNTIGSNRSYFSIGIDY